MPQWSLTTLYVCAYRCQYPQNLEKKAKEDAARIRKLEDQLSKASAQAPSGGGGEGINQKQVERELQNQVRVGV
jgi:pyruvate-formate lyase-activating enzyme